MKNYHIITKLNKNLLKLNRIKEIISEKIIMTYTINYKSKYC